MLLKSDCYMEKFSDLYGTTAFQGTPLKNFRLTSRLKRPFTEKIKRLRRITLRKSTHIPLNLNMVHCYTDFKRLQDNPNNYIVFRIKIKP